MRRSAHGAGAGGGSAGASLAALARLACRARRVRRRWLTRSHAPRWPLPPRTQRGPPPSRRRCAGSRRRCAQRSARPGPNSGAVVYDLATTLICSHFETDARARRRRSRSSTRPSPCLASSVRQAQLHTTVLGTGHLSPAGFGTADLYLRGDGDPTFGDGEFNHVWAAGHGHGRWRSWRRRSARGIQQRHRVGDRRRIAVRLESRRPGDRLRSRRPRLRRPAQRR